MTTLQDLHRALSEAESGSRELDADIELAMDYADAEDTYNEGGGGFTVYGWNGKPKLRGRAAPYTTDLNAITCLIERVLSGWTYEGGKMASGLCWSRVWRPDRQIGLGIYGEAPTEALARAIALVSALISQEGEK